MYKLSYIDLNARFWRKIPSARDFVWLSSKGRGTTARPGGDVRQLTFRFCGGAMDRHKLLKTPTIISISIHSQTSSTSLLSPPKQISILALSNYLKAYSTITLSSKTRTEYRILEIEFYLLK